MSWRQFLQLHKKEDKYSLNLRNKSDDFLHIVFAKFLKIISW